MIKALCPNCQSKIEFSGAPEIGQPVRCSYCGTNLEVVWLFPITLDFSESNNLEQPARSLENGFTQ